MSTEQLNRISLDRLDRIESKLDQLLQSIGDKYLTVQEVAELTGLNKQTIYRRQKKLGGEMIEGVGLRFKRSKIKL